MALLSNEFSLLDDAVMIEVSRHASGCRASKWVFEGWANMTGEGLAFGGDTLSAEKVRAEPITDLAQMAIEGDTAGARWRWSRGFRSQQIGGWPHGFHRQANVRLKIHL